MYMATWEKLSVNWREIPSMWYLHVRDVILGIVNVIEADLGPNFLVMMFVCGFFFQAEDGIRDLTVTGVQTCALPIYRPADTGRSDRRGLGRLCEYRRGTTARRARRPGPESPADQRDRPSPLRDADSRAVRHGLRRDRQPGAVVHPALLAGPRQRTGHRRPSPPGVDRRLRPGQPEDGGEGHRPRQRGDGTSAGAPARLPAVPRPAPGARGPADRADPALHTRPVANPAVLEGAAQAHARPDPRRRAGLRRHRLPVQPRRAQLPPDV